MEVRASGCDTSVCRVQAACSVRGLVKGKDDSWRRYRGFYSLLPRPFFRWFPALKSTSSFHLCHHFLHGTLIWVSSHFHTLDTPPSTLDTPYSPSTLSTLLPKITVLIYLLFHTSRSSVLLLLSHLKLSHLPGTTHYNNNWWWNMQLQLSEQVMGPPLI